MDMLPSGNELVRTGQHYVKVINEELIDKRYDEIFMPLPKDAEHFLDSAFKVAIIYFFTINSFLYLLTKLSVVNLTK